MSKVKDEDRGVECLTDILSVVEGIASKITIGEDVTMIEIESLASALSASTDNAASDPIPFLDRNYLHTTNKGPTNIVRFVGMVQDMLDTEFYETNVNGKSTHYRDVYHDLPVSEQSGDPVGTRLADRLAERTPLLIVPIPFSMEWFKSYLSNVSDESSSDSRSVSPVDVTEMNEDTFMSRDTENPSKKRERDTENESEMQRQRLNPNESSTDQMSCDSRPVNSSPIDWWPAGCMGSSNRECPVLAKVNYERIPTSWNQRRLRLNDVVEIIGVLSVDPMDADFSQQTAGKHGNSGGFDDDMLLFESAFRFDRQVLPPPSLLPRLQVLCYNLLDLEDVIRRRLGNQDYECAPVFDCEEQPSVAQISPPDLRTDVLRSFGQSFSNSSALAEVVLLALLSMAQRRFTPQTDDSVPSWDCVSHSPSDATLGCASLNLKLKSGIASKALYDGLQSVLEKVVPILVPIDLTLEALNNESGQLFHQFSLSAPRKDTSGRLQPSPFQLPKGATVLIHTGNMNGGKISANGHETLAAIQTLVTSHQVPYLFDSFMKLPYEADYRVIVVSSSDGSPANTSHNPKGENIKLFECTIDVEVPNDVEISDISQASANQLRAFLASCRKSSISKGDANNVSLSAQVLDKAQNDFIARRANRTNKASEEDFHRWLTLTRLQARSRGVNEATVRDWDAALRLDDSLSKK